MSILFDKTLFNNNLLISIRNGVILYGMDKQIIFGITICLKHKKNVLFVEWTIVKKRFHDIASPFHHWFSHLPYIQFMCGVMLNLDSAYGKWCLSFFHIFPEWMIYRCRETILLFIKVTSKWARWRLDGLLVIGLYEWNSLVTGEFPSQRASNAENVSIWWRHHAKYVPRRIIFVYFISG